jgi:hypothetical protein
MAYGQIDPARLDGDALTRWYLRSPADIEQERQAAAAQRYDNFFSAGAAISPAGDNGTQGSDAADGAADAPGANTRRGEWPPSYDRLSDGAFPPVGNDQMTASPFSLTRVAATGWPCVGCHGTGIAPPPPAYSKPPWATPWTPGPNLSPRRPAKPHPPQCAMQNMDDSRICSREPGDAWKSVCLRSASDREAYCISHDGEIGWPPLETHDRR